MLEKALIEQACIKENIVRENYFSTTYRVKLKISLKSKRTKKQWWDITRTAIPFDPERETVLMRRFSISEDDLVKFYRSFAQCFKVYNDFRKTLQVNETLRNHISFVEEYQEERKDAGARVFYTITQAAHPLTDSKYIHDNEVTLKAILEIGKQLIATAIIFDKIGGHINGIDLDMLTVDEEGHILLDSFVYASSPDASSVDYPASIPQNAGDCVIRDHEPSLQADIHAICAVMWALLSEQHFSTLPDTEEPLGAAPETLREFLEKGLNYEGDKEMVKELDHLLQQISDDELANQTFRFVPLPSEEQLLAACSSMNGEADNVVGDALTAAVLAAAADKKGSLDAKGDPEADNQALLDNLSGKTDAATGAGSTDADVKGLPSAPDPSQATKNPNIKKVPKKIDDGKKKKLNRKQLLVPIGAGAVVLALVGGVLFANPDSLKQTPITDSADAESSFVNGSAPDDGEESHFSSIEKEDEEEDGENSVPSSSTYSSDDEDEDESTDSDSSSESSSATSSSSDSGSSGAASTSSTSSGSSSGGSSATTSRSSGSSPTRSTSSTPSRTSSSSTTTSRPKTSTSTNASGSRNPSSSSASSNEETEDTTPVVKPPEQLSVSPASVNITVGENAIITPTMTCMYSSDSSSVATVENGRVVGVGVGSCTITAKGVDGQLFNIAVTVR